MQPNRRIEGQITRLGRTMHAIAYDAIHDEIVVPQQFAQAILTFRGAANGEEAPLRGIQGSLTQLSAPDQLAIDPANNEIIVPEDDHVLIFRREADGNAAPIRVLKGPDALRDAGMAAVDSVHNLLIVTGSPAAGTAIKPGGRGAIMIFDRTAQGNTKPKAVIAGPKVMLAGGNARVFVYPPREEIIVVANGYVGVWNIHDSGDVAPRWTIGGPNGILLAVRGVALDPKHQSIIISDKRLNSILTYHFPEIF